MNVRGEKLGQNGVKQERGEKYEKDFMKKRGRGSIREENKSKF